MFLSRAKSIDIFFHRCYRTGFPRREIPNSDKLTQIQINSEKVSLNSLQTRFVASWINSRTCSSSENFDCLKMAQTKPILYSYFRSSCSWRVRISLAFKNIDYEYKAINLLKGDQYSEEFLKINPCGSIPVLVDKGNVICSSTAILEYLEETVPSPSLLPSDPVSRAHVRAIEDSIVASIQPLQNVKVLKHVGAESQAWGKHWVESGFNSLEKILETTHGEFSFGNQVTLADVCLVPQVFNANRFNVDMAPYPLIREISSRLNELKEFKVSHPFVQPDCPDDLKVSS